MADIDQGSDGPRGIKRIRQACQNCRRKKTRCGGERPVCSYCARLGQECQYDGVTSEQQVSELLAGLDAGVLLNRISTLESKLKRLGMDGDGGAVTATETRSERVPRRPSSTIDPRRVLPAGRDSAVEKDDLNASTLPELRQQIQAVNVYFQRCHNQPYCYFHEDSFHRRLRAGEIPSYLVLAVMASSARFSPLSFSPATPGTELSDKYAEAAWSIIMQRQLASDDSTQLHLVQATNMLAIVDFTSGRLRQGWVKIGISVRFAQELHMVREPEADLSPTEQEEFRRTFYSVYLLDKLVSCGRDRPDVFQDSDISTQLPCSELSFRAGVPERTTTLRDMAKTMDEAPQTLDHFALVIMVASCLGQTSRYMLQDRGSDGTPPWSSKSNFIIILSRLFEVETMFGFSSLSLQQAVEIKIGGVDQQRVGHLIFSQMLFHLTHCLLSHPFLIRERLKHLKRAAPITFLRETFKRSREHADHMLRLATDGRAAGYLVETSFYGYCMCIAGGVQVLYLNDKIHDVREQSSNQLRSALTVLAVLADKWKHLPAMITALNVAAATSASIHLTDPECTDSAAATDGLDVALWWYIVDYGTLSDSRSSLQTASPAVSHAHISIRTDLDTHQYHDDPITSDGALMDLTSVADTRMPVTVNTGGVEPPFANFMDGMLDQSVYDMSSDLLWEYLSNDNGNAHVLGDERFWPRNT